MGLFDKAKLEKLTLRACKPAGKPDEPRKVSDDFYARPSPRLKYPTTPNMHARTRTNNSLGNDVETTTVACRACLLSKRRSRDAVLEAREKV